MATALPLIACSLPMAAALVVRGERARAWLLLVALAAAPAVLIAHVADASQVQTLRHHPSLLVAAAVAGVLLVAGLAVLFSRVPGVLPLAAVAMLPLRIPLSVGGSSSNLLVGLYLVVAAGALAWAVPRVAGRVRDAEHPPGGLEWALAAVLLLYAVQAGYSDDTSRATENVAFFYVPFAILFVIFARLDWTPRLLGRSLGVLTTLALALAAVGYVEYATRHLLLNPKVIASNQVEDYFRVNSLFFDPNIFGRFLALVLIGLMAWMLWNRVTRGVTLGALATAVIFGGLVLTLSQSSFAALLVGLAVLAALFWDPRRVGVIVGVLAIAAIAGALATGAFDLSSSSSAKQSTSGRSALIAGGARLFAQRPVTGHGSGSFAREYRRAEDVSAERATSASHTIPVTVAAEQGLLGLAAYLALLGFALVRLLRGARRSVGRAAVAAAFCALVAHTLMYAAFLEDPLTWALLGVGTALAAQPDPEPAAQGEPA